MASSEKATLRVCTYNIRFIFDRWPERRKLLQDILIPVDADVYGFQEVLVGGYFFGQQREIIGSFVENQKRTDGNDGTRWVAYDSPGARSYAICIPILGLLFTNPIAELFYDWCAIFNEYFLCLILGSYVQMLYHNAFTRVLAYVSFGTAFIFGTTMIVKEPSPLAILPRGKSPRPSLTDVEHMTLRVGGWRSAQAVVGKIRGQFIAVVNVHLSSSRNEEDIRVQEAEIICNWIDSMPGIAGSIIMGDFNCYPDEPCYQYFTMHRGYTSAYKSVHGKEPTKTFHQDHECITKDIDDEATLDYVMFKGSCFGKFQQQSVGSHSPYLTRSSTRKRFSSQSNSEAGTSKPSPTERRENLRDDQSDCCDHVSRAYLLGTKPLATDTTLYPSDHYGVVVEFDII